MTIEAIYENGMLRPSGPLPLKPDEKVTITLQLAPVIDWPEDTAEIYKELEADDRQLVGAMWPSVKRTWPIVA